MYAATVGDAERIAPQIDQLATVHPDGRRMLIRVLVPNPWPLPWYLRGFERVGYWETVPDDPDAPVILASQRFESELRHRLHNAYEVRYNGLRRDETLLLYIDQDLYAAYRRHLESAASRPAQP